MNTFSSYNFCTPMLGLDGDAWSQSPYHKPIPHLYHHFTPTIKYKRIPDYECCQAFKIFSIYHSLLSFTPFVTQFKILFLNITNVPNYQQ